MKKAFFLFAVLCCCISMKAQNVIIDGYDEIIDGFGWYIEWNDTEYWMVYFDPEEKPQDFYIVDKIYGHRVTSVLGWTFGFNSDPDATIRFKQLTSIGANAFYRSSFITIDVSQSPLTQIDPLAFSGSYCNDIRIPNTVTTISESAFTDTPISSINLTNVTYIGEFAFSGCSHLTNITLRPCMRTLKRDAFRDCNLESLTLYNSIETFETNHNIMAENGTVTMNIADWSNTNVLSGSTGITLPILYKYNNASITGNYTLPDGVTSLGQGALYHCPDLTGITLPAALTQIGAKAFAKCENLAYIISNATTAPTVANVNAFDEVDKTIPVTIPDNATAYYSYIHTTGWEDFTNYQVSLPTIKEAAIMELVHTGGNYPSTAIQDLIDSYSEQINAANDKVSVETAMNEGVAAIIAKLYEERFVTKIGDFYFILFPADHSAVLTYGGLELDGYATDEYTGDLTIPATVTDEAGVTYNITTIGERAFQNCTGITSVTLPESITTIEDNAFNGCSALFDIVLPDAVVTIGNEAFSSCTLRSITLSASLNSIGDYAFSGCSGLTSINCPAGTPCHLGNGVFASVNKAIPLTIPDNAESYYAYTHNTNGWQEFTNYQITLPTIQGAAIIELNHAVGNSPSQAMLDIIADYTTQINAASDETAIDSLLQEGLAAIIAQQHVERDMLKIGDFYYILNAESYKATVTYGGLNSEGYTTPCYSGDITIPATVTDASGITYDVTAIGEHAFQNCSGLRSVAIPSSVITIGDNAFKSCTALEEVLLPMWLNNIGNMAFYGCSSMTSITSLAYMPCNVGWQAFYNVNKSIPVVVPDGSKSRYETHDGWRDFTNFVTDQLAPLKEEAKAVILEATGSYYSYPHIGDLAMSFCLRIDASLTAADVNALREEGVLAITYAIPAYEDGLEDAFGNMGTEHNGPAIEVTKGTKSIILYQPDKVEFIMINHEK